MCRLLVSDHNPLLSDHPQDLEGQRAGLAPSDRSGDESFRREKTRQNEEITQLKEHLESARAAKKEAIDALDKSRSELIEVQHSVEILTQRIESLDSEKAEVHRVIPLPIQLGTCDAHTKCTLLV